MVLVHDGARPLVTPELVQAVIRATAAYGAAIPILPIAETVKRVEGELIETTVDREGLGTAQTPQGASRRRAARGVRALPARCRTDLDR